MKSRIFSIMDTGKKKTGLSILCVALMLTVGTGAAFAANAATQNQSENTKGSTQVTPWIAGAFFPNPDVYAKYADFGITISEDGSNMESIISLHQVSKSFSRRCVLSDISLDIEKVSTIGIVGINGSGKWVLFNIICGFMIPDSGEVCVRGRPLGKERDFPENMGVLINAPGCIGLSTGLQNLRYLAGIRGAAGDEEIHAAMRKVGRP